MNYESTGDDETASALFVSHPSHSKHGAKWQGLILNGKRLFNWNEAKPIQLKKRNAWIDKHTHITILWQMNDLDS